MNTMLKIRPILKAIIHFLLIFALAIPTNLVVAPRALAAPSSELSAYNEYIDRLSKTREGEALQIADNFHIAEHKQYHRVYELIGERETLKTEFELGSGLDPENKQVAVANYDREIRIIYDANIKELRFERYLYNEKLGREILTDAHVIVDLELQTSEGRHVLTDDNFVFFQTEDGLRAIVKMLYPGVMFKARLPMITVTPSPTVLMEGVKVKEISFFNPAEKPRTLISTTNGTAGKEDTIAGGNDIMTRIELPNGDEINLKSSYRFDILRGLSARLPFLLSEITLADPNLKDLTTVLQILRDYEEFKLVNKMARSMVISRHENPSSDLGNKAMTQLAQVIPRDRLIGLIKQNDGQNEFDRLANQPWDEYELKVEWPAIYEKINYAKRSEFETVRNMPWQKVASYHLTNRDPESEVESAMNEAAKVQEKNEKRYLKKLLNMVKIEATPRRLSVLSTLIDGGKSIASPQRVKALSAMVAGDVANLYSDGAVNVFLISMISKIFDVLNYIPGMSGLTSQILTSSSYFLNTDFALVKVTAATMFVLSFRPLAYFISNAWARKAKGENWTKAQAFFTGGARIFARANAPLQKLIWENLFKQKHLYESVMTNSPRHLNNKVRQDLAGWVEKIPFLNQLSRVKNWIENERSRPTAYNAIFPQWAKSIPGVKNSTIIQNWIARHDAQIERNREGLRQEKDDDSFRNTRALLLAAVIVSEKMRQDKTPIDPAHLLMLMQADQGTQLETYMNAVSSAPPETQWSTISQQVYKELVKLTDKGISKDDTIDINKYYGALRKVADKYNRHLSRNQHMQKLSNWTQSKWNSFVTYTSKNAIPFLLFSPQGYELSQRYKTAIINKRHSDSAAHQFDGDYDASTLIYAASDAKTFGATAEIDPRAAGELVSNQLDQIFIYGLKAGVEFDQISMEAIRLLNPSEVQSTLTRLRSLSIENTGHGREQRFIEGTREIFKELLAPNSRRSLLATQVGRMSVQTRGLQVNFLAGAVPRGIALMLTAMVAGGALTDAGFEFARAVPMQLNMLFSKLSIFYDSAGGLGMGYAVIWAAIAYMQNVIKDKAEDNLAELVKIDSLFDKGIRWESENHWRAAVVGIKELYKRDKKALPEKFNINNDYYDLELARELSIYSLQNPPVSTIANSKIQTTMNQFGALVSTVLFVALSNSMWDPNAEISTQLMKSLASFGLTYMIALEAQPVVNTLLRNGHQAKDKIKSKISKCSKLLRGRGE